MPKAKQIFEASAWFCDGLPPGDDYSRETAEAGCREFMGRAAARHCVKFGPLRWSELKPGDARVPPPTGVPTDVKLLHVEATVVATWERPPREEPRYEKSGAHVWDRHKKWPDDFVSIEFLHKPALPVTDEQVQEIAASLDVGEDSEHVAAVLAAIRRFHGRETAMAELPPGDHRTRDIETLEALARGMEGLNPNVLAALARHGVDFSHCDGVHTAECARLAAEDVKRRRPPPKRGARSLESREILLRDLAVVYTDATERSAKVAVASQSAANSGQPTGRFFKFIRAAVVPLPSLKKLRDHALHQAVKRATSTKSC